jgi:hypothetical protein
MEHSSSGNHSASIRVTNGEEWNSTGLDLTLSHTGGGRDLLRLVIPRKFRHMTIFDHMKMNGKVIFPRQIQLYCSFVAGRQVQRLVTYCVISVSAIHCSEQ